MVSQIFVSIKNLGKFQSLDKRKAEIRKCTGPQKDKVFQSRFLLFTHFCCFLKGEWYLLAAWLNETKASILKTLLCHTSGPPAERHQVACARKLCNLLPSSTPSLYHLISPPRQRQPIPFPFKTFKCCKVSIIVGDLGYPYLTPTGQWGHQSSWCHRTFWSPHRSCQGSHHIPRPEGGPGVVISVGPIDHTILGQ